MLWSRLRVLRFTISLSESLQRLSTHSPLIFGDNLLEKYDESYWLYEESTHYQS